MSYIMAGVVAAGVIANNDNGRGRNGVFIGDGFYHEQSQLSFLGAGSITYRVLGYDYRGQDPNDGPLNGNRRIVELPWQLAPHGRAVYAVLSTDPEEYADGDKINWRLVSPYIGEFLAKFECCTEEEMIAYEDVAEGGLGFLTRPDPEVHYTRTAEECRAMVPAYETFGP